MKYTGNTDPSTGPRKGTLKLMEILVSRWGFKNLGIWANRPMRSSSNLSVHATGRALDAGIPLEHQKTNAWVSDIFDWLVKNYEVLGIEEVHQYWWKEWGRGFRCSRPELGGKAGVREWTAQSNGGSAGGKWLHIELSPAMADNPEAFVKAWKSVSATAPAPKRK